MLILIWKYLIKFIAGLTILLGSYSASLATGLTFDQCLMAVILFILIDVDLKTDKIGS